MAKTREQKEKTIDKLKEELSGAKGAAITTFSKMPVKIDQQLRQEFYNEKVNYGVIKKTLLQRVLAAMNRDTEVVNKLSDNVALAISQEDEVTPARILSKFAKDNEQIKIVGGYLEGKWIDNNAVKALAGLPGKNELLGQLVRTIQAPLTGLAGVLAGNLRGLVNALNAVKDKKAS